MLKFVITPALFCIALATKAQDIYSLSRPHHSFHFGYSISDLDLDINPDYQPFLFLYHRSIPLTKIDQENIFELYYEPQINPVFFKRKLNIEFGINAGISYSRKFSRRLYGYLILGSGPHFINTKTERQATGFVFSDNLALGIRKRLPSNHFHGELNIQYRFRHISNAGLRPPNGGINNGFILIGFTREIGIAKRLKTGKPRIRKPATQLPSVRH